MNTVAILLASFILSVAGLFVFIWSLRRRLFEANPAAARSIFTDDEIGRGEDPAASVRQAAQLSALAPVLEGSASARLDADLEARLEADRSSAFVTFLFLGCAMVWLLVATAAGLISSIKLHEPEFLGGIAWLSFGRLRTLHLNAVAYGWAPMAALGIAIWMLPRLLKTHLVGGRYAIVGAMVWNAALIAGLGCIASGVSDGMEWLEIPWQVDILFVIGGALVGLPLVYTLQARRTAHLYVSVWYMGAALFWFPTLFFIGNLPAVHNGIAQATMNWWFGHNVLGLFYTPMALASIYYFLPKTIGRPVQSYNLSLLGFWSLAFFYGQVGGHHLIGGPVPEWLVTLSIVQSVMMLIPVLSFSINQHMTMRGYFDRLRHSPTLRFIVLGGMMYTLSSVQGSIEALRSVNTVTHFTHFTVAHAHLGLYGFFTMVMFGAVYFVMPRVMAWEWPYPALISLHFWLVVTGFSIYFVGLSIGGWLQGMAMLDAKRPFMDSVAVTLPYLKSRTVGGSIMALGHLVFVGHFIAIATRVGRTRSGPALLNVPAKAEAA
jgi:cytochrome c oxidase cbb3-type subunit 1